MAALSEFAKINPRLESPVDDDQAVSFLGMADVSESGTTTSGSIRRYAEVKKGYTAFADRDLLVAKITPCFENGKIAQAAITSPRGFGSTEFHVVRPDPSRADARYVLHALRSPAVRAAGESRMTGSAGQRRVPKEFLESLDIPLPPLREQRRIASILDQGQTLRSVRVRALVGVAAIKRDLVRELFERPGRKSEPLGDLIVNAQNGLYVPASGYGSGSPILRIADYESGDVLSDPDLRRVDIDTAQLRRFQLKPGDIVVNRVNAMSHVGKSALVGQLAEPTVFESNMMRVEIDHARLDPVILLEWLSTQSALSQIRSSAKQAINQASVNQKDIAALRVPIFEEGEQREFLEVIRIIDSLRRFGAKQIEKLDELFASLQHRAFRGEL